MITKILIWYLIGILLSAVGIFAYEYFYYYDKEIKYISKSEIVTDLFLMLLSWGMVLLIFIFVIIDMLTNWPSKGVAVKIKKGNYVFIVGGKNNRKL